MKLDNIKIVFLDIDGTLINSSGKITDKTKESINKVKNKGIYVVLVSGRDVIHTINMSKKASASSIVIATNGGEIFDYDRKKYILFDKIDDDKLIKIWNYCEENKIGIIIKTNSYVYYNKDSLVKEGIKYKLIDDIGMCNCNASQLLIMSNKNNKIEGISDLIKSLGLNITSYSSSYLTDSNRDYFSIDVNNTNISKGLAISYLLKHLNIKKEDSICFGDFVNDIEMFNACGVKVAMGNAVDELKKESDYVTDTNDDDGVANFLNNYL